MRAVSREHLRKNTVIASPLQATTPAAFAVGPARAIRAPRVWRQVREAATAGIRVLVGLLVFAHVACNYHTQNEEVGTEPIIIKSKDDLQRNLGRRVQVTGMFRNAMLPQVDSGTFSIGLDAAIPGTDDGANVTVSGTLTRLQYLPPGLTQNPNSEGQVINTASDVYRLVHFQVEVGKPTARTNDAQRKN